MPPKKSEDYIITDLDDIRKFCFSENPLNENVVDLLDIYVMLAYNPNNILSIDNINHTIFRFRYRDDTSWAGPFYIFEAIKIDELAAIFKCLRNENGVHIINRFDKDFESPETTIFLSCEKLRKYKFCIYENE
jgi:hypothetical protein